MSLGSCVSVIIRLPNGVEWFRANWIFRQLAKDVRAFSSDNRDVHVAVERAEAYGILDLQSMDARTSADLVSAFRHVAKETADGGIEGWRPSDSQGREMYLRSLSELAELIAKY